MRLLRVGGACLTRKRKKTYAVFSKRGRSSYNEVYQMTAREVRPVCTGLRMGISGSSGKARQTPTTPPVVDRAGFTTGSPLHHVSSHADEHAMKRTVK